MNTLRDKCVTVTLNRSMFTARKRDDAATATVENSSGVSDVGNFNKKLLKGCTELKAVYDSYAEVYQFVMKHTLPWCNDGVRIIPNRELKGFLDTYKDMKMRADQLVNKLVNAWDVAVQRDRVTLGNLWNPNDYPDKNEIADYFGLRLRLAPISTSEDFRVDIADEYKAELDDALDKVERSATPYLLDQILQPVKAMADKLMVQIGEKGSIFRDTLVSNLTDVCDRAEKLNINGDQSIMDAVSEIRNILTGVSADVLRSNATTRSQVQSDMDALASKINGWLAA